MQTASGRKSACLFLIAFALIALPASGQTDSKRAIAAEGADESPSHLVDENAYYRVSRLRLAPTSTVRVQQHNHDAVAVVLSGDAVTFEGEEAFPLEKLGRSDVRFLRKAIAPVASNASDQPAEALLVELKQHWDAEIHTCAEPMKCKRPIIMGGGEIGETTLLFTNGFVTAYRHRIVAGGTLTSSYFSEKGKDHLLLIALTGLIADFDGAREDLKQGEVYSSDATEVGVNAGAAEVQWIVIRVQTPKH